MLTLKNQSRNNVNIVGKLVSANVREGVTKNGAPYVSARCVVRVDHSYLGITETSDIPVSLFSTKYNANNTNSTAYDSIKAIEQLKTIQSHGLLEADTVRFSDSSTRLSENTYVSSSGKLNEMWQINARYVNRADSLKPDVYFSSTIYIINIEEELVNGVETGRLKVKGALVQWGEKVDVLEFIVEHPDGVADFNRLYEINSTINIWGTVRATTAEVKKPVASESSWGEPEPSSTSTRSVYELIVTGAKAIDDEDYQYDPIEIKRGYNQRKADREQMQNEARNASTKKTNLGWD